MHFSIPTIALLAATSAAAPNPVAEWKDVYITGGDSGQKREVRSGVEDAKTIAPTETLKARFVDHYISGGAEPDNSGLAVRDKKKNFVSSCKGDKYKTDSWLTKDKFDNSKTWWNGWERSYKDYCYHITHSEDDNPTHIGPKDKFQSTQPFSEGRVMTIGGTMVDIQYEINNKGDSIHTPNQTQCEAFFKAISTQCGGVKSVMGKSNVEVTRGGTYQIGESEISYHAFITQSLS
ncbi:hypothetical protein UCRNP2_170 [Neofusicoccum parvum UCRNP2]|uniref:Uncharacterized protein n=1 Tax=Botryosphaeria parva (strain UCR-NP2) TaxID=1287680 RepID=R1H3P6_BOTPV|nr:hypothetical protein UCRNP2_170 [Neofusicoccum parvum UCRNP2]